MIVVLVRVHEYSTLHLTAEASDHPLKLIGWEKKLARERPEMLFYQSADQIFDCRAREGRTNFGATPFTG